MQPIKPENQPFSRNHLIIHHHYHYSHIKHSKSNPTSEGSQTIKRIKSVREFKSHKICEGQTQTENITLQTSQRTWKKFVKRQFQSAITPKEKSSIGQAIEQAKRILNKRQERRNKKHLSEKVVANESEHNKIATFQILLNGKKDLKSNCQYKIAIDKSQEKESNQHDYFLNPESQNSHLRKQSQDQNSFAQLGLLTQRDLAANMQKSIYKFNLLQEECGFLRSKFLQHYQVNHPKMSQN